MTHRGLVAVIVVIVAAIVLLFSAYYIVYPSEWTLVLQLGKPVRVAPDPDRKDALVPGAGSGLYFKIPFVQNVVYLDKRVLNFDAPSEEVPTLDQNQVIVSAFARFQIVNPLLFYQTVHNEDGVQARLRPVISSNLRRALGDVPMATILTSHRADLMKQITQQVDTESQQFGIKVIDVRMKRVDLTSDNAEAIYRQMQTQRQQLATGFRATGQAQAIALKADADKQQVIILADARQKADILRGEGDAQATRIYAEAYGRDPGFFDFYRSMLAMSTALTGDTTTYVGPPDGDFFRYFLSRDGMPTAPNGQGTMAPQSKAPSTTSP
jgi:modulator of FtsH protease HflC